VFNAPYAPDDAALARQLLANSRLPPERERRIDEIAAHLIEAIRAKGSRLGGIDDLLREYSISTKEGVALMVLAEALLRIPERDTADRLIEDKLKEGNFASHTAKSEALLINVSAWALGVSSRVIHPGETPQSVMARLVKRLGLPAMRVVARKATELLGDHFVLGQTIAAALHRAETHGGPIHYSFDMLAEGARTRADAKHYLEAYSSAIEAIGRVAGTGALPHRPGVSVKLSALHPRYDALNREAVLRELVPDLLALARLAKSRDLNFTVDAEEADRLELSLDVIARVFVDGSLAGWEGFGLAIQAYQKRASAVIEWAAELAGAHRRRMMLRLVKGAYWDTEIKRAQERGLADYPVFTRKAMTDLNYMASARRMLALRPRIFPQFATHNALTVGSIIAEAEGVEGFEFQRLHGMGEELYAALSKKFPGAMCRIYAPVGEYRDLLAYLMRRLLENGANSSFVSVATDPAIPVHALIRRPAEIIGNAEQARHPRIPLPPDLYGPERRNSKGVEFGDRASLAALMAEVVRGGQTPARAAPIIDGTSLQAASRDVVSPIDGTTFAGQVAEADVADAAIAAADQGFAAWNATPVERRAAALERAADLLETRRGRFIHLLAVEGGKTIDDAVAEVREAADFCRYYAAEARKLFGAGSPLPGPTGETNVLALRGRGVFVAISPWNFPLAIFTGQIAAALAAGNCVVAKPAEQTPLVGAEAIRALHEAGVPVSALHFVPGDGRAGARLVAHPQVGGIVFTGSTEVARSINGTLAKKEGAIIPLIAETGGINAMIVDATALPEQVTDDVITSAFRSAGQRCSALRLLCVQEDVAGEMIEMIIGAVKELKIGDPREPSTNLGPIIDAEAKARLDAYVAAAKKSARLLHAGDAPSQGFFVAPHIFELERPEALTSEVFGPILHVVRYRGAALDGLLDALAQTGYGLTLGIHSRISATAARAVARLPTGNIYVNRNMIGAVVGVQPFGGSGLSGTGPKAGGPHYLSRFAIEQTVTVNTAAAGGNAALVAMDE